MSPARPPFTPLAPLLVPEDATVCAPGLDPQRQGIDPPFVRAARRRIERWQRIGLGIRLAYNAQRADVVRLWLGLGRQLARDGCADEGALLTHALRLLLQTAADPALPWVWRHVCLEHTARPLSRLTTLRAGTDPAGVADWHASVRCLHDRLEPAGAARA
jgi:hypothetical protein